MTTTTELLRGKDFAEHAINALADIKRSLPKDWKRALEPYKTKIRKEAANTQTSDTNAVLLLLEKINKAGLTDKVLKIQHFFLLAAYGDML
jgi:hypothetical protein